MHGAVDAVCRDAARLLREGQAARAYSGLVAASRSLTMTPRLAAALVRCALKAGTERAVITLLDAAMVTERGAVRREVRRQLSRVLRRTGQEARAAAVLNGLLMDAPDDARARYVLDVLRERQAKAKGATSRPTAEEDEESRTKTVEVSALALSDPDRGNTVVEMPTVPVEAQGASARAARADTVQVPLGEWAGLGRVTVRGPDFPWEDEGPGKARVVTPPQGARMPPTAVSSAGSPPVAGGEAERARSKSTVGAPTGGQSVAGSDSEKARAASTAPVGGPFASVVERPGVVAPEPPEFEREDAALSFRSTDLPFVTADTDRRVSEAKVEREPASPVVVGASVAVAGVPATEQPASGVPATVPSVASRDSQEVPPAVVDAKAGTGDALTPGALRSLNAGTDLLSKSPAPLAVGSLPIAADTGKSTLEQAPSSQSDAKLPVESVSQASGEKSVSLSVSSPVDPVHVSDEALAAALGVSAPVDAPQASDANAAVAPGSPVEVTQAPDEKAAVSLGTSSSVDARQATDANAPVVLGASSSVDARQASDEELAAALGVSSSVEIPQAPDAKAAAASFGSPSLDEEQSSGKKAALEPDTSPPLEVKQASDESSSSAPGASSSVEAQASDEELAAALGVSSPVEMPQASGEQQSVAASSESSPVEVTQSRGEESVVASSESSPVGMTPSRGEESAVASSESSPVEVTSSRGEKSATASSESSPVEVVQSSVEMSSAASVESSPRAVPQSPGEKSAEAAGESPPLDVASAPGDKSAGPGVASQVDRAPPLAAETATSSAPSTIDVTQAQDEKPTAASTVEVTAQALSEKAEASGVSSRVDVAQASAEEPTPPSALSFEATQAPNSQVAAAPGVSLQGEASQEVSGLLKAADAHAMAPSRPVHTSTPQSDAEVPARDASAGRKPARVIDSVLVQGAPSHAFDEDESTSEMLPPRPPEPVVTGAPSKPRPLSAVLVPGAPAMAFDEEESTSEVIPPAKADAEKDAAPSPQARDEKSRAQPSASAPRRTTVLVPAASNPAFEEEESTSEVIPPPGDAGPSPASTRDAGRLPPVKSAGSGADVDPGGSSAVSSSEEGAELARSQREESQLIARRAWRELAQLYLKRADRAKDAPARAEALTRLAEVMENELQDSAGAARMYREIVELTGERTALREQVRLLSMREDASLVRRALDDAIKRARTSRARAIALLTRGERQLNMGAPAKAREDLEAAEALVPGLLPVLAGLVRCVSDEERPAHAERLRAACAAAPRRAPDRLDALRVLAQTAEESLGDLRIAQWAWAEVLAESPDSEQPREQLLALARRLGDLPALSQLLHAQLAREPRGPAARKAHLERVATLEAMGDAGAALAELRQAVRFEPGHKEAWLLLADRCTEREQMGEAAWALENAATATEDDEERQRMWERLALFCREVLHNTERARTYARRAESLRKSREARVRPPPPEPPRPAPAPGVPPPSVLVAPPVPTGRVPVKSKDLSDEVTSNTDIGSLGAAEASSPAAEKRPVQAKDGAARKSASAGANSSSPKSGRGTPVVEEEAPSGSQAPVAGTGGKGRKASAVKAPSGSPAPVDAAAGARRPDAVKAPSGGHATVEAAAGARKASGVKAPSGSHAPVPDTSSNAEASRKAGGVKAPSGSQAPVEAATAARRSGAGKASSEGPPSLAEAAPGPSTSSPSSKSVRGSAKASGQASDTDLPARGSASMRNDEAPGLAIGPNPRAPASPPRERTTAFGAPLSLDSEPVPPQALGAAPTPSAVSRKAAASAPASRDPFPATPKARASAPSRADSTRQPPAAAPSHPW
ncbi:hypothetical protein, partial [Corallococcus terminator]